ncbi:MAG: hypothetical protein GY778_17230, partial [bacterium]|nr:hypothetical protein [bacterium]
RAYRARASVGQRHVRGDPALERTETIHLVDRELTLQPGALEVEIKNRLAGTDEGLAPVELILTDSTGSSRRWTLDPIQPDRWNHLIVGMPPGAYRLEAQTPGRRSAGSGAVAIPPVREVFALPPDRDLLDRIADLQPIALRRATELGDIQMTRPFEVWPILVASVLLVVLLNVLVRRWPANAPASPSVVATLLVGVAAVLGTSASASGQPSTAPSPLPETALRNLEQALVAGSDDPVYAFLDEAGRLVVQRDGSLDALVDHLRERVADDRLAARALARVARSDGRLTLARDTLVELVDSSLVAADVLGELASVEELLGNTAAAQDLLSRALAAAQDQPTRLALSVRQALLYYATGDKASAQTVLREACAQRGPADPVVSFCAHLAGLNADYELACDLLEPGGEPKERCYAHLFRGLWLLRLTRPAEAMREFEKAYTQAPLSRDRRFVLVQMVTAARVAGRLPDLADRWLTDTQLSPDRLRTLVAVLRELGRADDALGLLHRPPQTPEQHALTESAEFQRQVIIVAAEAGRERQAEAAYRSLLEGHPKRVPWRAGLARLLLLDGRRDAARRLFGEGIELCDDSNSLLTLAEAARDLTLDESALAASAKSAGYSEGARVRAVLFEADLARLRGQSDRTVALLDELSVVAERDADVLLELAEAHERFGDQVEALRLFEQLYQRTQAEDVLLRVAWLLEENQLFDRAYTLWKQMWRDTTVTARLRQAQERLLDLAARTGRLADLATELEERLDEGRGQARELSLLVDIYTAANDPVSAAEILLEFSRLSGDRVQVLERLARVYLGCEQFGRCNAVLRRLVELDPANAGDYLQQIAIVALERRRPQEARVALRDLAAVARDDQLVEEFSAGVLDMLGLHAEAVQAYARVLAGHPDRIEALLLWGNAMKSAGRQDRAVARFQDLVEEAREADLFAVAVDGLLNLDAKPAALESALRRVHARIAATPHKVFLYRLAADLLEALGRGQEMRALLEQAVVIAGERRGPLLRELMDGADSDGDDRRLIHFGRTLVYLGDQVPPQVFLDLGRALIRAGQFALAGQVFDRASRDGDYTTTQQRVAAYFEEADLPARADRLIRELLIVQPDSVPLLLRSSRLSEQLGNFERSFERHYQAVDLLLRRQPRMIGSREPAAGSGDARFSRPSRPRRRAANVDEIEQYFEAAATGLLGATRGPGPRTRLLDELPARVEEELDRLSADRLVTPTIARNPALARLISLTRRTAFALQAPELADRMDRRLLEAYPGDAALRTEVIQSRWDWGLFARATEMAEGVAPELVPTEVIAHRMLADSAAMNEALTAGNLTGSVAMTLVPQLVMSGRDQEARRALRAASEAAPVDIDAVAATMIAAAVALKDSDALQIWMNAWLDAVARVRDGRAMADGLRRCLRSVWPHLSTEDRSILVGRIGRLAESLEDADRLAVDLLRLPLAKATGQPMDDLERICRAAARAPKLGADDIAPVLEASPPELRSALLRSTVAARQPVAVRPFLLALIGELEDPANEEFVAAFESLFKSAPPLRLEPGKAYSRININRWTRSRSQSELGRRIGEVLLSEMPNETAMLATVAVARHNAGLHDEALLLAVEAFDALAARSEADFATRRMMEDVAGLMTSTELEEALEDLEDREVIEGVTPTLLLGKAIILAQLDRRADAADALQAAYEAAPDVRAISRKLIVTLKADGQQARLARLLDAHLAKSTIMEAYEWRTLATLHDNLFKPKAALRAAQKDQTVLGPVETMRIARLMGNDDRVRSIFRRLTAGNRAKGRHYTPTWPAEVSQRGMEAYLVERTGPQRRRTGLFVALADLPFAIQEFSSLLAAAPPGRRDAPGLIDGLLAAADDGAGRDRLLRAVSNAHDRGAATFKEHRLLVGLAAREPGDLPEALAGRLGDLLAHTDPTDVETMTALADIRQARGDRETAGRILRWVVSYESLIGHKSTRLPDRLKRLDSYLDLLPEAQRQTERTLLLDCLAPTPLDRPDDAVESARARRWADAPPTAEGDDRIRSLRQRVRADDASGNQYRSLAAAIARADAAAGRFARFVSMLHIAFSPPDNTQRAATVLDCFAVLPPADQLDQPERYAEAVAQAIQDRRIEGDLGRLPAARSLCLLGRWCADHGLSEHARSLLDQAEGDAGALGEHWLWLADLARSTGDVAKAIQIETGLLEAEMLPMMRVAALLAAVEESAGPEAAATLAVRAARYSDHPDCLRRAMASARRHGDSAAEAAYRDRLKENWPAE